MSLTPKQQKLQKQMLSPFKFGLFKLFKLPLALLTGIKLKELSTEASLVTVKYKHLNTNPFKSMYFAVLAMAAELSTGALALFSIAKYKKSIAVLVVESHGKFHKKATGKIRFICEDGKNFESVLDVCVKDNTPGTFKSHSKGYNDNDELVCEYYFTWSFKVRK